MWCRWVCRWGFGRGCRGDAVRQSISEPGGDGILDGLEGGVSTLPFNGVPAIITMFRTIAQLGNKDDVAVGLIIDDPLGL